MFRGALGILDLIIPSQPSQVSSNYEPVRLKSYRILHTC